MTTTFDKTNSIMTHTFKNNFKVIVNFKESKISTLKDEKPLETLSFEKEAYSLADYENLLITVRNVANY